MNATSGNFGNFAVNLNNQQRNTVMGSRQIPIAKFTRGSTRGRGGAVEGKRVTSINFYQSNQGQKLKNALDLSMNLYDSNSGLNDSLVSGQGKSG